MYTHLWIALCAAGMVLQTSFLLSGSWIITPLVFVTFGGTLFIYAIHRLVGLAKLKDANVSLNPRYLIINRDQQIVLGVGILGAGLAGYYFFQLQLATQLWMTIPGVISLAYVLPFFSGKRRLRDIGMIKIFLIAFTYAILCVLLVHVEEGYSFDKHTCLLLIEKALFIFAITIPFDVRDLEVDKISGTTTLPKRLGWRPAVKLAQLCTIICAGIVCLNTIYDAPSGTMTMIVSYFLTYLMLRFTHTSRKDLFYSFGIDGTMILQTTLLYCSSLV